MRSFTIVDLWQLLQGLRWTLFLSAMAFVQGGLLGLLVAYLKTSAGRVPALFATAYVELVQGIPLLMLLFLGYFGLALLGLDVPPLLAASLGLTVTTSAFLGDIWAGAIRSIPAAQSEAAASLGLGRLQQLVYVIVPQATRRSLPPTVGFLVALVKATSLTSIIGFIELTRRGQLINNATYQPFVVFGIVALLYYAICFPLAWLSRHLEARGHGAR